MSLLDLDTWITEYDACERLSRDIQSQIVQRNQQPRLSTEYSRISGGVRFKLKQFVSELQQLNANLGQAAIRGSITVQETERRQRQIEQLQSKYIQLQTQFTNASGETTRIDLFQSTTPSGPSNSIWENDDDGDYDDVRPLGRGKNYSVQDLRKQQTKILDDQNEGLEALSKVIARQKNLALQIGDEVDVQNDLLDDLAVTMENTDSRINSETRNVNYTIETDSTKGYWLLIIILFVAILIVSLL